MTTWNPIMCYKGDRVCDGSCGLLVGGVICAELLSRRDDGPRP